MDNSALMRLAMSEAKKSGSDVPVGALVLNNLGKLVSTSFNQKSMLSDPTAHAEINAIRLAAKLQGDWRLSGSTLVVTLEPCLMCVATIIESRISKVVFGCWAEENHLKGGYYELLRAKGTAAMTEVIGGVLQDECALLLTEYFKNTVRPK